MSPADDTAPVRDADLIARYDRRVPRYTSYPTAPHFTPAVGAGNYADWLARGFRPRSRFRSICTSRSAPSSASIAAATPPSRADTRRSPPMSSCSNGRSRWSRDVSAAAVPVAHIHWGGGTPSILSPERSPARSREAIARAFRRQARRRDRDRDRSAHADLRPRRGPRRDGRQSGEPRRTGLRRDRAAGDQSHPVLRRRLRRSPTGCATPASPRSIST